MKQWIAVAQSQVHSGISLKANDERPLQVLTDESVTPGDAVALWRPGRFGGLVALGRIRSVELQDRLHPRVRFYFDQTSLSSPLTTKEIRAAGVNWVSRSVRSAASADYESDLGFGPIDANIEELGEILQGREQRESGHWQAGWVIPPGSVVKRKELHAVYGGSPMAVAGSSGSTPNTFLHLRGAAGRSPRLVPYWGDGVLVAPGHIQDGEYISQDNLMILLHLRRGLPLRVFECQGALCRYLGEFLVDQDKPIESWRLTGEKKRRTYAGTELVYDLQFPLFRLKQVNGVRPFTADHESFASAPRFGMELMLASTRQGATSSIELGEDGLVAGSVEGVATVRQLLRILRRAPEAVQDISQVDDAQALASLIQYAKRKADLRRLREVAEDPQAPEAALQHALRGLYWVFGGQFVGEAVRRRIVPGDEVDIPLIRADGSWCIVEIKRSMGLRGPLVKRHRNGWVASAQVHDAVGQASNYLVGLDEQRQRILEEFGYDVRRARAAVLIGHPAVQPDVPEATINEVLRRLNTQMSRIEVLTYKELLENAERSLGEFPQGGEEG
ncbi:Shedu anti-phage system protein SduA domain-containing protein [Streptomyces malaysiensis]|uniref:Shedu anti-phage system protein SduA domain-containing protein n=1 Tax=Streptomyces malaysiensis TaxID=92644 RepID=UPI0036AB0280